MRLWLAGERVSLPRPASTGQVAGRTEWRQASASEVVKICILNLPKAIPFRTRTMEIVPRIVEAKAVVPI